MPRAARTDGPAAAATAPAADPVDAAESLDVGAAWLNLLATQGQSFGTAPVERLQTPAQLAAVLAAAGLAPRRAPDADDVRAARALREALRAVGMASLAGTAPEPRALRAVRERLDDEPPARLRRSGGALAWERPADAAAALGRLARQAVGHLLDPSAARHLKVCAEHDCRLIFVDHTGRRRWCPSPRCGTKARVRALRERRRAD